VLAGALGSNLVAAYLHGSAVLGRLYRPDRSDLDILALTDARLAEADVEDAAVAHRCPR
jgi:predicted nucleotidyltransferase